MKYLFIKILKKHFYEDDTDPEYFPPHPSGPVSKGIPISDEEYYEKNINQNVINHFHFVTYYDEDHHTTLCSVEKCDEISWYSTYCRTIIMFGEDGFNRCLAYDELIYNILLYCTEEQKKYICEEIKKRIGYDVRIRSFIENEDLKEAIQDYLSINWKEKIDNIFKNKIKCIAVNDYEKNI